ncbi:MAG: C_GCAxxG_C_C family protein [Oscillospiraceae bacterium]|nr:C_GCAxxG_C_C family protein [Oscillospiraceae bacterium]
MEKYDAGKAARDNFLEGYNCSQSVYMALAPLVGKDRMSAARTSAFLGGGICRTRNMCGAVLGMLMACGDADGNTDGADQDRKGRNYLEGRELMERFREEFGSLTCRELLEIDPDKKEPAQPEARTEEYYRTRPCSGFIEFAARMGQEYIDSRR